MYSRHTLAIRDIPPGWSEPIGFPLQILGLSTYPPAKSGPRLCFRSGEPTDSSKAFNTRRMIRTSIAHLLIS